MVSPNGVGMGHLTRLLAVARRLPGSVEPIFLTMSQAVEVVERYGFHAEYLPYHAYYGGDPDYWNRGLLARLQTMVGFYDPRVILFDTLMGKGVPFLEQREKNHFIRVDAPEWQQALAILDQNQPAPALEGNPA